MKEKEVYELLIGIKKWKIDIDYKYKSFLYDKSFIRLYYKEHLELEHMKPVEMYGIKHHYFNKENWKLKFAEIKWLTWLGEEFIENYEKSPFLEIWFKENLFFWTIIAWIIWGIISWLFLLIIK